MKNCKAIILRDQKNDSIWMYESSGWGPGHIIELNGETLDLTTLQPEYIEVESIIAGWLCIASATYFVLKEKNENYTVMIPYYDSMGYGAIYRSILTNVKDVYSFCTAPGGLCYVFAKDINDKWGCIELAINRSVWRDNNMPSYIANIICDFYCDSLVDLIESLNFSSDYKDKIANGDRSFVHMVDAPEDMNHCVEGETYGKLPKDIIQDQGAKKRHHSKK